MDVFDERILSILKDGKSRGFSQLLNGVEFSHNTLKLHLKKLLSEELLLREKTASKDLGRPSYVYAISPNAKKQVSSALSDQSIELVHLPFSRLKHLSGSRKVDSAKKPEPDVIRQELPSDK